MGQSTDAILFYGYIWDEETRWPWDVGRAYDEDDDGEDDEDDDWEGRYARTKGCLPPALPFPDREVPPTRENGWSTTPTDYTAAEQAIIDQHSAYWEMKRELAKAAPCLVDNHCSDSSPMPYVAVRVSVTNSSRGNPHEITSLAVDPSWDKDLAEFCTAMEIDIRNKKPGWWLASYWSI